jgi:hypothetical protein
VQRAAGRPVGVARPEGCSRPGSGPHSADGLGRGRSSPVRTHTQRKWPVPTARDRVKGGSWGRFWGSRLRRRKGRFRVPLTRLRQPRHARETPDARRLDLRAPGLSLLRRQVHTVPASTNPDASDTAGKRSRPSSAPDGHRARKRASRASRPRVKADPERRSRRGSLGARQRGPRDLLALPGPGARVIPVRGLVTPTRW